MMRYKTLSTLLTLVMVLSLVLCGCGSRNPAGIKREKDNRPPEARPPSANRLAGTGGRGNNQAAPAAGQKAPPPAQFASPGKPIEDSASEDVSGMEKMDLEALFSQGKIQIESNDSTIRSDMGNLFDANYSSLCRSSEVNPLELQFTFPEPITITMVRTRPSHSAGYRWQFSTKLDQPGWELETKRLDDWSRMDLPEPIQTTTARVAVLRTAGDNYVHLDEVEIYTVPAGSVTAASEQTDSQADASSDEPPPEAAAEPPAEAATDEAASDNADQPIPEEPALEAATQE